MRFSITEAQVIAIIFFVGIGMFTEGIGHSAPTPKSTPKTRGAQPNSNRPSVRRHWDSDLMAHPHPGIYRRRLQVAATAYQPIDDPMEGGRWTKTERDGRAAHGVAVDPALIPLGTRLWIPGYGHALADDIGGAIKGHRIDLRMQSAANMRRWGVRTIPVYILD